MVTDGARGWLHPSWDDLPEGLRHPKNLAILAIERVALPAGHPCRLLILQGIDRRAPEVAVAVQLSEDSIRTVPVIEGDDPASLATRVRAAVDALVEKADDTLDLGDHRR